MPQEPLPWDRKDFFKERKHERSEFLGPVSRWRDSSNHGSREFSRWGSGDFRRPPGHGRQGGWHLFSEEYGHGYGPSTFSNNMLESVSSRSSVSHGDGKYARNGRENRSFSNRDWKGHSWMTNNGSTSNSGRLQHDLNYDQRSVHDMPLYPSHYHSDFVNSRDKVKGQHDKINDVNGLGTNKRRDRDYSMSSSGWKPLKWTRSSGLSSRSSASGYRAKSIDALDSNETKSGMVMRNATQKLSPSGDPADCVMSAPPFEEPSVRKKPRLGWGEGLAKYEKKKVEVPDGAAFSNGNAESTHSLSSSLIEKGHKGSGFSDCTSPATPSSVVCCSSPGVDEKLSGKAASLDNGVSNLHDSPSSGFQNQYQGPSYNLEKIDNFSVANLGSPLIQLLQSNDSVSVDSGSMSSTAMSKLLIYKNEISEVLEMTESEIDLLENELKGLRYETRGCFSYPSTSGALMLENRYLEEHSDVSNFIPPPAILQAVTSGETTSKSKVISKDDDLEEVHADIDGKDICSSGMLDATESVNMGGSQPTSSCNIVDDVVASVDSSMLMRSEAFKLAPISSDIHGFSYKGDCVFDLILASNKESARIASEALNRLFPINEHKIDIWSSNASCSQNQHLIKERFSKRKQLLRFKERVITLKFRAFLSFWKESVHVPPVMKLRAKSQKKYQLSSWTNHSGYQKSRSSSRFRSHLPAGNLNPVSNMEILKHVSKQLPNSRVKHYRKMLKMPPLILDQKDKMASRFISNNGLVEDPCAVERERMMINPWTSEEKDVFMDKIACFGKDFRKIASFLNHKTTADCIEFYYKNHKSEGFEKVKKLKFGKKAEPSTTTYLVTTGKKWNYEMNSASLDMLSAASMMTARAHNNVCNQHKYSRRLGRRIEYHTDDSLPERATSFDIFGNEREKAAADVLAGICSSLSPEAAGSCITSNFDRRDGSRDLKCRRGSRTVLRWRSTDVPRIVDDDICSDQSCEEMDSSSWTDGEKSLFIEAVATYRKNFSMISTYVGTKSTDQCKVFFSKARKCLGLDSICTRNETPARNDDDGAEVGRDANGEGPKDACTLESGSICCSEGGYRMVDDSSKLVMSIYGEESDPAQTWDRELKENDPSSKIDHTNACNREDSPRLASGVHNQPPEAVAMNAESANEVITALAAESVGNAGTDHDLPHLDVSVTSEGRDQRSDMDTSDQSGQAASSDSLQKHRVNFSPHDKQGFPVGAQSCSLSVSEQSFNNGDVKLFGQSPSNPSALQKSESGSKENGNRTQLHHKFKRRLKVNSHQNTGAAKLDHDTSSEPLDEAPSRSYGIWDGNRICSGLSSFPDPAILRARYPDAFDRFLMPSSENQQQQPIGNEQKLNGGPLTSEVSCSDKTPSENRNGEELSEVQTNGREADFPVRKQEKQMTGENGEDAIKLEHNDEMHSEG